MNSGAAPPADRAERRNASQARDRTSPRRNCDPGPPASDRCTATAECIARINRRDSRLEFWSAGESRWVRKFYHAKFRVSQEVDAYGRLQKILEGLSDVRTATINDVDDSNNSMDLVYVCGWSLAERAVLIKVLNTPGLRQTLLTVMVRCKEVGFKFDLDPSNVIVEDDARSLVFIDPVCESDNDMPDYTAVVFFWGLIKCFLRNIHHAHDWRSFVSAWRRLRSEYLICSGTSSDAFSEQLSEYIKVVARWNLEQCANEGWAKRSARVVLVVPAWQITARYFRWRATRQVTRSGLR